MEAEPHSWRLPPVLAGAGGVAFRLLDRVLPHVPAVDRFLGRLRYWRAHGRFPRASADPSATFNDLVFERMSRNSWTLLERICIDKQYAKLLASAMCPRVRTTATLAVFEFAGPADAGWLAERLAARRGRPEVAKSTHGSGAVLFLRESPSVEAIRSFCEKATQSFYFVSRESQYRDLPRKVIVEEDLSRGGMPPTDYKFFCAKGEVLFCQVDVGRFRNHLRTLVTPSFQPIDVRYAHDLPEDPPARPESFDLMLEIARDLSRPFGFVRIDLYTTADGVYFGEFTFAPEGGAGSLSREEFGISVMQRIRGALASNEEGA